MSVLLLTGTIKPLVEIKHNNPDERRSEYSDTIMNYVRHSNFDKIVFVENSGYSFPLSEIMEACKSNNKQFEFIDASQNADRTNMSTGEAVMMRYALENSDLLSNEPYIWKSTGRVFIRNINKYIGNYSGNVFLYSRACDSIQTWFFGVNKDALQLLLSDDMITNMSQSCIEFEFIKYYRKHKDLLKIVPFKVYPDAVGVNSNGHPYTLSKAKYILKSLALVFGYFTVK